MICSALCHRFLADRFVEGICPFCAYEVSELTALLRFVCVIVFLNRYVSEFRLEHLTLHSNTIDSSKVVAVTQVSFLGVEGHVHMQCLSGVFCT